jgi:hypothetical protein
LQWEECVVSKAGWYDHFREPIPVPKGDPLATLSEAGAYIIKLPRSKHDHPAWRNAIHALIQAADHSGPIEFARLAMIEALYPKGEPVYDGSRKDRHSGRRKLVREQ